MIYLPSIKQYYFLTLICSCLLIASCGSGKKTDPRFDDSQYEKLATDGKNNFYRHKDSGNLYIKTITVDTTTPKKDQLLYYYRQIPPLDLESYQRLNQKGYYAKDKNHVYFWETDKDGEMCYVLENANPTEFMSFAYLWGKDSSAVYYKGKPVTHLNPSEVELICYEEVDSTLTFVDLLAGKHSLFIGYREIKAPAGMNFSNLSCVFDLMGNLYVEYHGVQYKFEGDSLVRN